MSSSQSTTSQKSINLHSVMERSPEHYLWTLERTIDSLEKWFTDDLLKGEIGALHSRAERLQVAFQLALKLDKPKAECLRYLRLALECYVSYFKISSHPGQWCDCEINGHAFRKMGDDSLAKGSILLQWLDAFDLALILKDHDAIEILSAVPESLILRSELGTPNFLLAQYRLLKNLYNEEADFQALFEALFATTGDHQLASDEMFRLVLLPPMLLMAHAFSPHEDRYQSALQEAMASHRAWFTKDEDAMINEGGWVSLRLCAMAALAFNHKGWVVEHHRECDKEYVPLWLTTGQFD